jgi:uracil-DNA glycosylase family 4
MSEFNELLEATIDHLQTLKHDGLRYVRVSPDLLDRLTSSPNPNRNLNPAPALTAPKPAQPLTPPSAKASPPAAPAPILPSAPLTEKARAMAELRDRAGVCQKCSHLASSRKNVVFGVGSIDAELMFVGEAPGAEEDVQGEPFVGKAGQLLTKIIQTMGLSREQVYIANILKCRPDTPGQGYGNRPPTTDEMKNCLPYLHAQIDLIKPKMMVALGATAVAGLFGQTPGIGITKLRGQVKEYRGIPVMLTYHPSYLLRPNVNNVKREVWEDMLKVMEFLGMPISEKQRSYFLKP